MPIITLEDVDIYYEREGKGPPLLVVGGFTTNHLLWKKCLGDLAAHYDLIIYDQRGAGKSSTPPGPYTIAQMAGDAAQLLKALSIESAYMIGFSMGSLVVEKLSLSHPNCVKKAILATPFASLPAKSKLHLKTMGKLFQSRLDPRLVIENVLPWLYSNDFLSRPENIAFAIDVMTSNPYPQSPEGYAAQGAALLSENLEKEIGKIQTPTLIIAGEEDILTPLECAHSLVETIPNASLITLPKVGHMLPLEKSQELMAIMRDFFR